MQKCVALSPEMVRKIGLRMKTARELCRLSQVNAARRLGYQNSSKLSRLEAGVDTNSVPIWLIVKASTLYDVSTDYLLGISDEFDATSELQRGMSFWLAEALERSRLRDIETLRKLHKKVLAMENAITAMLESCNDVKSAMQRFSELNPEFEDMRASNRLLSAIERASDATNHARSQMDRFRMECTVAASGSAQLSLMI